MGCVAPNRKTWRSYLWTICCPSAVSAEWSAEGSNSTTFGLTTLVVCAAAGSTETAHSRIRRGRRMNALDTTSLRLRGLDQRPPSVPEATSVPCENDRTPARIAKVAHDCDHCSYDFV